MLAIALCAVLTAQLQETITVSRVVIDVRVTKDDGEPVTGLTAADFDVRIGRRRLVVESAEWIADAGGSGEAAPGAAKPGVEKAGEGLPLEDPAPGIPPGLPAGRLFVFFVQTDFARDSWRTQGQMKFLQYAGRMLDTLGPQDRAAVFSFDSHLKFRLDFSGDREAIEKALVDSLFIDHPPPPPVVPAPSLAARLDRDAMRRAAHSESGLLLVANALRPIPGPKSLVLLGWGLGERSLGGVRMKPQWEAVRYTLDAARVTIFALDTTDADYHDLEMGLIEAAEETGGFYAKTHVFPEEAIERLQRTLSGHYELTLGAVDDLEPGIHDVRVRVKRRRVTVLAPTSVFLRR